MNRVLLAIVCFTIFIKSSFAQCPSSLASYYNVKVCEGGYFSTSYVVPPGSTWLWTGPNGFSSTNQLLEIFNFQQSNVGTYQACVTVPGCPNVACGVNELVISLKKRTFLNKTICAGGRYIFPGGKIIASAIANATYYDTSVFASTTKDERQNFCDSLVYTILKVDDVIKSTANVKTCSSSPYTLPDGRIISKVGNYQFSFNKKTAAGCDSIAQINLVVDSTYNIVTNPKTCTSKPYTLPDGRVISKAGTYQFTFTAKTIAGCDSNTTINLIIDSVYKAVIKATSCSNNPYTLPDGKIITKAGTYNFTYNLKTTTGCDSLVELSLQIDSASTRTIEVVICKNQPYVLPDGKLVTTEGDYPVKIKTLNNCDSTIITKLKISNGSFAGVQIASAFTPNNDGINDVFKVSIGSAAQFEFLKIYNRWGQLIFFSTNYLKFWDGTYKNTLQQSGSYVYFLRAKDCEGKWQNYKGTVTMLQ
jgi:gliding motility-associated-like protein